MTARSAACGWCRLRKARAHLTGRRAASGHASPRARRCTRLSTASRRHHAPEEDHLPLHDESQRDGGPAGEGLDGHGHGSRRDRRASRRWHRGGRRPHCGQGLHAEAPTHRGADRCRSRRDRSPARSAPWAASPTTRAVCAASSPRSPAGLSGSTRTRPGSWSSKASRSSPSTAPISSLQHRSTCWRCAGATSSPARIWPATAANGSSTAPAAACCCST